MFTKKQLVVFSFSSSFDLDFYWFLLIFVISFFFISLALLALKFLTFFVSW